MTILKFLALTALSLCLLAGLAYLGWHGGIWAGEEVGLHLSSATWGDLALSLIIVPLPLVAFFGWCYWPQLAKKLPCSK